MKKESKKKKKETENMKKEADFTEYLPHDWMKEVYSRKLCNKKG